MKAKNETLLLIIKIGLDIVWYCSLLISAGALCYLITYAFSASPNPVNLYRLQILQQVSTSDYANPLIRAVYQNPVIKIAQIVRLAGNLFLILAVIYNLRKVFGTVYRKEPFQYQNITRLKMTALFIVLPLPLNLVYNVIYRLGYSKLKDDINLKAYHHGDNFRVSHVSWQSSIQYLAFAAIVYIMAEILNYGLELKRENEEFI